MDKAEVIEHDQPIKALQGKVVTNDVAMNIKLRPEARDQWMITLRPEVLISSPLKNTEPEGGADALQIGKKRQWMYSAEYDRSGKDLWNYEQMLATGGTSAYNDAASVPSWFGMPSISSPLGAERVRFNRSYDFTAKNIRKTADSCEQRFTAGYTHTYEEMTSGNTSVYYFNGGSPVQTDQTDRSSISRDNVYFDFTRTKNTHRVYGNEYFRLDGTRARGVSAFSGTDFDDIRQTVKMPEIHAQNTFTRLFTRGKLSWQLYSNLDFHYSPQEMEFEESDQKLDNILYHADNRGTLRLSTPFVTHSYTLGVNAEHLNLRGRHTMIKVYATPSWQYKRGKAVVNLNVPVNWTMLTERGEHYVDASPSLSADIKTGRRGELSVSAEYGMSTGGWRDFVLNGYTSDYRTQVVTEGVMPRQQMFFASAYYQYKRPVAELFVNAGVSYSHNRGNTMTDLDISDGRYTLKTTSRGWHGESVSANALVSKGFFDIHLKTKLEVKYSYATGQQLSLGSVTGYRSGSWSAAPEIVFTPSFGKFTYHGTFSLNSMSTDETEQSNLLDWSQSVSYTQTIGKVDISLSAVHCHNELQSAGAVNALLADAEVVWRLKKVRLSADVRNLFNKRRYTITSYSGIASSTDYYVLRPREIVITAQVSI